MKPVLVIMAAGMGSRYGGLKQTAPVDAAGHVMIDYLLYDAYRAGFRKIVCVIHPDMEKEFAEHFKAAAAQLDIFYAHQKLDCLPKGYKIPPERKKPWGTAHAVLCATRWVEGPFAVINADDFYGAASFRLIYDFLVSKAGDTRHAMVGYPIENTLTDSGYVSRGICGVLDGRLTGIQELTRIKPCPGGAEYTEDGSAFSFLPAGTMVSMNLWGFGYAMLAEIEKRFETFLADHVQQNPLKCEYFLPSVVGALLSEKKVEVDILPTPDRWYGITYAEDMPRVRRAIERMKQEGSYPERLWEAIRC